MTVLSAIELKQLITEGVINAPFDQVNAASIDVRLGDTILLEKEAMYGLNESATDAELSAYVIDLSNKETLQFDEVTMPAEGVVIYPSQFFLASTVEVFNLPSDISCQFVLKSSLARSGVQHMLAGWCDAGWNDATLTLELKNVTNYHALVFKSGMKIGQMVFHRHRDSGENSYAKLGQYNGQRAVQVSKGVR